jgi:hypothetical protein
MLCSLLSLYIAEFGITACHKLSILFQHGNNLSHRRKKMNNSSKLLIAALAFGGSISTASAAGDITDVTASGAGLGSFDKGVIGAARTLDFT